ncbi:MAG: GNAT family N-acetyltransferase [Anaerolineae bacterium]
MLTFRPLTTSVDDLAAANLLLQSAFQADSNWEHSLRRYIGFQPDGWIVAEENGQPVAMVGAVEYGTYAYIGMMAVHESQQRRGIGMQVMEQILAHLDRKGCPIVLLDATKSGAGSRNKLGFTKRESAPSSITAPLRHPRRLINRITS